MLEKNQVFQKCLPIFLQIDSLTTNPNQDSLRNEFLELVRSAGLVIEKSAKVVGSVTSEDLVIRGRIIGPVFGKKVRFGSSARVEGDTFHETIAIEDGAYYEGSIRRQSNVSDTPNTAANDKLAKSN